MPQRGLSPTPRAGYLLPYTGQQVPTSPGPQHGVLGGLQVTSGSHQACCLSLSLPRGKPEAGQPKLYTIILKEGRSSGLHSGTPLPAVSLGATRWQ